ncbi:hypothetical protein LIER_24826 [Lithospermum erythrorhizon]|uniref:Uncharacterized protein n=1 Tax=Lithospermum erythrorhizon TaxID=34254 RepID=A0AAV3R5V6_LITER
MGSDLFGSYAESSCAALLISDEAVRHQLDALKFNDKPHEDYEIKVMYRVSKIPLLLVVVHPFKATLPETASMIDLAVKMISDGRGSELMPREADP